MLSSSQNEKCKQPIVKLELYHISKNEQGTRRLELWKSKEKEWGAHREVRALHLSLSSNSAALWNEGSLFAFIRVPPLGVKGFLLNSKTTINTLKDGWIV